MLVTAAALALSAPLYSQSPQQSPSGTETKMGQQLVYVGTYTQGKSEGIYVYRLQLASGALSPVAVVGDIVNPSFLAIHPNRQLLYAVNEVGDDQGGQSGAVSAYRIDEESGSLTFLNRQPSEGAGPCHLVVDSTGRYVLVANYNSGSVAALPIAEDGRLGKATSFVQHKGASVNPRRQAGPHAHSINLDAGNRFAMAADLGLDQVLIYRFDATEGTLRPAPTPQVSVHPGAGPRHFSFHPAGRHAYVINELDSTITAFSYDAGQGVLKPIETVSTLPKDFPRGDNSTAEVQVHPSGKFLYGSNRGHDSIAVFGIDADSGRLSYVENESTRGKTPRNFGIDPTGTYLLAANQASDTIVVFRIDGQSGQLEATGHTVEVPTPVCVKMIPVSG